MYVYEEISTITNGREIPMCTNVSINNLQEVRCIIERNLTHGITSPNRKDPFFSRLHDWEDYVVASYLLTTACCSLLLNALVIITCIKRRTQLVHSDYFIINLAISDLILSVIGLPFGIFSSITHKWKFGVLGCWAYGYMGFFCGVVSITTLAIMSFSRYISVCQSRKSATVSQYTWLFIVGSYIYACVWATTPIMGWGQYGVEPYGTSCTLKWNGNRGFITLMLILCIILPVIIMKLCYGGIYLYLRRNCKTFKKQRSKARSNIKKREGYLLKMTFTMCCAFMATWSPYAVVSFWSAYGETDMIPVRATLVAVLIAKFSTVINPLVYFILNKRFWPYIFEYFSCVCSSRRPIQV